MSNTVEGNDETNGGGGVFNAGGTINITGTTIARNSCENMLTNGGGLYNDANGNINITVSTISSNTTMSEGGAIYNNGDSLSLNAVTIVSNTAEAGGGFSSNAYLELTNSIVANNTGITASNVVGTHTSAGYNLIGDDAEGNFNAQSTDQVNANPMTGELEDNGGPTMTHSLMEGSPAFDTGDPNANFDDQRGEMVFNGRRDIGSYEAQMVLTVTEDVLTDLSITVYPNPTDGIVYIKGQDLSSVIQIELRNSLGQLLRVLDGQALNSGSIMLTNIPTGNNYLIFRTEEGVFLKNVIRQ